MKQVLYAVLLILWNCGSDEKSAQLKVARSSNAQVAWANNLFRLLIGRLPQQAERRQLLSEAQDSSQINFYHQLLNSILHSDAYHQEGFWHLHRDRLLLASHGSPNFIQLSQQDYDALRFELQDVSYANNYWQILKYRQRWLNVNHLELNDCAYYMYRTAYAQPSDDAANNEEAWWRKSCRIFLQASFDPAIAHPSYNDYGGRRRFVSIYQPICCPQIRRYRDICQGVENAYRQVLAENYCDVVGRQVSPIDIDNSVAWSDEKMHAAISAYVALRLSEEQMFFVAASVPKLELHTPFEINDYNPNYYLKVEVPPLLQGIHASPFWLSQHPSSEKNRDLHRARLIYHSWFCESISPDNATQTNPNPAVPEKFLPYFSNNDQHTKDFGSCFNCHKMVQPLANYFRFAERWYGLPKSFKLLTNYNYLATFF